MREEAGEQPYAGYGVCAKMLSNPWHPSGFLASGSTHPSRHAAFQVPRPEYSLLLKEEKISWGPLGHGGQGEH